MKKRIVFTVTNELLQDQRMNRICTSLANNGYNVTLVGRRLRTSWALTSKPFRQKRIYCFFTKGKLFYFEYNFRLFFYLLFQRFDILCGIDLDTILPTFLLSKIKRKPFVYDAHEYFTEMEEVVARPWIKKAWETVEKMIVPRVKYGYTVSENYASMFAQKYGVDFEIIRNATLLNSHEPVTGKKLEPYILYQGSVNVGRGLENLIEAMKDINCRLYICGKGDILEDLKKYSSRLNLDHKVIFYGFVEPEQLKKFTRNATLGITFFSKLGLSNYHSLANRFFDYLHSGVPQIAMSYPEYKRFNERFEVASLIGTLDTPAIVNAVNNLLNNPEYYYRLSNNCLEARKHFNWQIEEEKLLRFYEKIV